MSIKWAFAAILLAHPALADGDCSFDAFSDTDKGDAARVVYEAPDAASKVLGVAPIYRPDGADYFFGTEFTVVSVQGDWVQVRDLRNSDGKIVGPDGWINGAHISLFAQTDMAFSQANPASDVVWSADPMDHPDWPVANALLDCDGEWALIRFSTSEVVEGALVPKAEVTGWVRGVCAQQATECDRVYGDALQPAD